MKLEVISLIHLALLPVLQGQEPRMPQVETASIQTVKVNVNRLKQALDYLGRPFEGEIPNVEGKSPEEQLVLLQKALDPFCLAAVTINPEGRASVLPGPAKPTLVEQDWAHFLVKVINEAGVTAPLRVESQEPEIDATIFIDRPMAERLSGAKLDYRLILVKGKAAGKIATVLTFDVGQGTQDLGFRADLLSNFISLPTTKIVLKPVDEKGNPTTAAFEIRDQSGKTWPTQANRVEPDFRFHPQVYRAFSESVQLPPGDYDFLVTRGPECFPIRRKVTIGKESVGLDFRLERWVDPAKLGWWSGDHHIHAAGCKHYESPSLGVHAAAMMKHCVGEDLKIGANLTWGPCFDYQKQFFTGTEDKVSSYPYLLRYDVEVSGFGSHRSGHLCLLRLNEQIFPGGDSVDHWPTLCLNTLKWAQKQGAVCGPAHSGWGLAVESDELPNYEIPPFDGIGANEYIVDVTHEVEGPNGTKVPAVDFLSMVDTPYVWELNIWYHTLNCGFRTRISGETDFPCIYGERVGLGRSYIKIDGKLNYDAWCQGISDGRGYVSDGLSHLIDMKVSGVELGVNGSELKLEAPRKISVTAKVAALLEEEPETLSNISHARLERDRPKIAAQPYAQKPYWHLERARIEGTREVKLELIVNGVPVASKQIPAAGKMLDITFDEIAINKSAWVALRILPSSHTNPIFVIVNDKPIRASKKSAQWCLDGVNQCWSQKEKLIDPKETDDAMAAYAHAQATYENILKESEAD